MRFVSVILVILFFNVNLNADDSKDLYVEVKNTKLRSQALHWAKASSELNYGDKLELLEFNDPWYKVKTKSGVVGYVHTTAVTKKVVHLKDSGAVASNVSDSDIVLAGKGFNKEIEAKYASDSPSLNYQAVDKLEAQKVNADDLAKFIIDGELNSEGIFTHAAQYSKN